MARYVDIEIYPNSDNPDDGMKLDWWDDDENMGYTYAGIIENQITPDITEIENIHGEEIGRIEYPVDEEDYLYQMVELVVDFCDGDLDEMEG